LQRTFIIAGFALFFIIMQLVTLYGCYCSFHPFRNKRTWRAVFSYALFLNLSYLFIFNRYPLSPWLKTLIDYLLIYPYFIYMLLCLVLFPCFIVSGAFMLGKKLFMKMRQHISPKCTEEELPREQSPDGRRKFLKLMTSSLLLPAGGCSLYGTYVGKNRLQVEEQKLFFPGLPVALDGLSIAQISDIHAGVFMEEWELQPYIDRVNELQPDIIVVTGDIISWGTNYIRPVVKALGRLRAKRAVYAVMGNHDFYGNLDELCSLLEETGVQALRNRWVTIGAGDRATAAYLAGIDDIWATKYFKKKSISLSGVLTGIPQDGFKILLCHNPLIFDNAVQHGIHLTLSGHTHGGQMVLPFPGGHGFSPARLIYPRDYGLYQSADSYLYINRGLGVIGPPMRINCPREITRIVLRRGTGSASG
jgi:predicted MPP superfamily phosphohydrolase